MMQAFVLYLHADLGYSTLVLLLHFHGKVIEILKSTSKRTLIGIQSRYDKMPIQNHQGLIKEGF